MSISGMPQAGKSDDLENLSISGLVSLVRQLLEVSHCSKNERGARTYEIMKSITATLALRGHQVPGALAGMINGPPMSGAVARQSIT